MTIKVSALELEDLYTFNNVDRASLIESAKFNLEHPHFRRMFSMKDDKGYLVAVIGASYISKGVWEGWIFPCADVGKYAKRLVREVKDFSDWALTLDIHRLQIAVLEPNKKWAESIGFQFESIVKNYHSNKDHFMYIKAGSYGC
jgi:RimJ/RimL family protein N-acetyltransferase